MCCRVSQKALVLEEVDPRHAGISLRVQATAQSSLRVLADLRSTSGFAGRQLCDLQLVVSLLWASVTALGSLLKNKDSWAPPGRC